MKEEGDGMLMVEWGRKDEREVMRRWGNEGKG